MTQTRITILDAIADRHLFGALPVFRDLRTWKTWAVALAAIYGLPLSSLAPFGLSDAEALAIWRRHTGRATYNPPPGGWPEIVFVVGRQSGKTRIAATIAAFEAMTATAEGDGTEIYAVLIAQDARGAMRSLFSYACALFERVPLLARSVVGKRSDSLSLESGCTLAVYPCRTAAVRGIRGRPVICDELAFYRSSDGNPVDVEMLRAVRPTLATTGGKLIILSSPYAQTGALYELHRKYFGRDDASVLVWQGSAAELNPTLPADYLDRMRQDDPEAYRSEVLGEFRVGVSTFLDPDALAACVAAGVRERPKDARHTYVAYTDVASGSGSDSFAQAIAHNEHGVGVLDVVRAWRPPFNPTGVIAEAADLLRSYGMAETVGDRYAPGFVAEGFRANGIAYTPADRDTSAMYLELLPSVNAARIVLLDLPELLRELRGLERRRGSSGRDRIDHRPGAHDDRAVAAAGALVRAGAQPGMLDANTIAQIDAINDGATFDPQDVLTREL